MYLLNLLWNGRKTECERALCNSSVARTIVDTSMTTLYVSSRLWCFKLLLLLGLLSVFVFARRFIHLSCDVMCSDWQMVVCLFGQITRKIWHIYKHSFSPRVKVLCQHLKWYILSCRLLVLSLTTVLSSKLYNWTICAAQSNARTTSFLYFSCVSSMLCSVYLSIFGSHYCVHPIPFLLWKRNEKFAQREQNFLCSLFSIGYQSHDMSTERMEGVNDCQFICTNTSI